MRTKLTKSAVDSALPGDRRYVIWDTEISGFGLRVETSGRKAYFLKYRIGGGRGGTRREPVIGKHGDLTPSEARSIAKDWAEEVRRGGDPAVRRLAQRTAPAMRDLCKRYLSEHAEVHKKQSSVANDRRLIETRLNTAIGRKKVAEVGKQDVARLHRNLADTPYEANRVLALMSKIFSLAEEWGLRPANSNPCSGIRRFREEKRKRYLSAAELARLGRVLGEAERDELRAEDGEQVRVNPYAIAAIRLLIFTGARTGEVLSLKWAEVNSDEGRLELPDSKTGSKYIRLSPGAQMVLTELDRVEGNPYVIVGGKVGSHLVNLKDSWAIVRAAAGLDDVRLHDLRHTYASIGASVGLSLPLIGGLLGHKDAATTARYAHLADDPLRFAAEAVDRRILEMLDTPSEADAEIVHLARKS